MVLIGALQCIQMRSPIDRLSGMTITGIAYTLCALKCYRKHWHCNGMTRWCVGVTEDDQLTSWYQEAISISAALFFHILAAKQLSHLA